MTEISPEALDAMHDAGLTLGRHRWAAYQNKDLGHPDLGHLQFLAVGPDCTFPTPPKRHPDTATAINWRYCFVGWVNLETGDIEPLDERRCSWCGVGANPFTSPYLNREACSNCCGPVYTPEELKELER